MISDQTEAYADSMASQIIDLQNKYKITFKQACKVMELTLKDIQNDVEWNNSMAFAKAGEGNDAG